MRGCGRRLAAFLRSPKPPPPRQAGFCFRPQFSSPPFSSYLSHLPSSSSSSSSSSAFPYASSLVLSPLTTSRSPFNQFRSPSSAPTAFWTGQKRSMFIQTQSTPNPSSLMFYPGKTVMEVGSSDFPNARTGMTSPLAKSLFAIDDFVTVTKSDEVSWDFLKPEIFASIMDFYASGNPLFLDSKVAASMDTAIQEGDSEIVAMIKELLETRIRPSVQDDGGDIEYRGYNLETGVVRLRMQGACSGCPSSSVTLKSGIENMLMHYIPEVRGVEQELDSEEEANITSQMD